MIISGSRLSQTVTELSVALECNSLCASLYNICIPNEICSVRAEVFGCNSLSMCVSMCIISVRVHT